VTKEMPARHRLASCRRLAFRPALRLRRSNLDRQPPNFSSQLDQGRVPRPAPCHCPRDLSAPARDRGDPSDPPCRPGLFGCRSQTLARLKIQLEIFRSDGRPRNVKRAALTPHPPFGRRQDLHLDLSLVRRSNRDLQLPNFFGGKDLHRAFY
jgi:hypothetical protein